MDLGPRTPTLAALALVALLLLRPDPTIAGGPDSDERQGEQEKSSADIFEKKSAASALVTKKLAPSCYAVLRPECRSNAGFVVGKEAVLVVDCFDSPDAADALLAEVRRVTDKPIRHVVLTSEFYDHVVGNQRMPEEATIYASKAAGLKLQKRLEQDRMLLGPSGGGVHASIGFLNVREPTQAVKGKTEVDLGGVTVSLLVAGECHGVGDLIAWVKSEKIVFAGDLVWNGCHPNLVSGSTFLWIRSLATLEKLDLDVVVPGHGDLADKGHVATQRRYLMALRTTVKHLARKELSVEKIVEGIKPSEDYAGYAFAAYWPKNVLYVYRELMRNR